MELRSSRIKLSIATLWLTIRTWLTLCCPTSHEATSARSFSVAPCAGLGHGVSSSKPKSTALSNMPFVRSSATEEPRFSGRSPCPARPGCATTLRSHSTEERKGYLRNIASVCSARRRGDATSRVEPFGWIDFAASSACFLPSADIGASRMVAISPSVHSSCASLRAWRRISTGLCHHSTMFVLSGILGACSFAPCLSCRLHGTRQLQ